MTYRVIVSDKARQMLGDHMLFIAEKDEDAARHLAETLLAAIRSLDHMPDRYPYFNERYIPQNKYHKMFVTRHYLILYQIRGDTVFVDFVVDCRQQYGWLV